MRYFKRIKIVWSVIFAVILINAGALYAEKKDKREEADKVKIDVTVERGKADVSFEYGKKKKNFEFDGTDIEKIKEHGATLLNLTEEQLEDADVNIKRIKAETVGIVKKTSGNVKKVTTQEPIKDKKADVKIVLEKDGAAVEITEKNETRKLRIKENDLEKIRKEIEKKTGLQYDEMRIVIETGVESGEFLKNGEEIITAAGGIAAFELGEDVDIVLADDSELSIDDIPEEDSASKGKVKLKKGKAVIKTGEDVSDFKVGMSSGVCTMKNDTTLGVNMDMEGEIGVGIAGEGEAEFKTPADEIKLQNGEWAVLKKMYKEIKKTDKIPSELKNDFKKMKDYMKDSVKIKIDLLAGKVTAGLPFEAAISILNKHNNIIKSAQGVAQIQSDLKGIKFSGDGGITWDAHSVVIEEGEGKITAESKWSGKIQISVAFQDAAVKLDVKVKPPAKRTIKLTLEDKNGGDVDLYLKLKRK